MTNEQTGNPEPKRRHSEKRQRTKTTAHRWLQDEFNAVAEKAAEAGLSFGAYVRAAAVGEAGPRAQRRLPVEEGNIRRVLALHNKYGSNMNQIAYQLNAYGMHVLEADFRAALNEWEEIRDATLILLGRMHPTETSPAAMRSNFLPPGGPIWPPKD
jgi:hypothetical protein